MRRRERLAGGRPHTTVVRLSDDELADLTRRAEAQNVSTHRFLVEAALSDDEHGFTRTERNEMVCELFAVRRQLAGALNNLNQLTRHANTHLEYPVGLEQCIADVSAKLTVIDDLVQVVSGR